jgi:hypothetical protein
MSSECPKIYNTWNPNKRYDDSSGWDNLLDSQIFQTEKDKCFDKIADMFVSNLIP